LQQRQNRCLTHGSQSIAVSTPTYPEQPANYI
jgi:hypothetical protein